MMFFRRGGHRWSSRLKRSVRYFAAITLTIGAGVLVPVSAAHAADTLTCTGTSHLAYAPGLTYTPQTVTLTETDTYSTCASSDPTVTSGYISGSFRVAGLSCADVTAGPDTYRVDWSNGQHSAVAFNEAEATTIDGIQQYVGTGTVVSGEFVGDTAVFTWIYALINPLDCLAPGGLTQQDGTVIGDITGV